ncbi:unnamed protein product [Ixodes hexagonus]
MEEDGNEEVGERSIPRRKGSKAKSRHASAVRNAVLLPKCVHKKKTFKCRFVSERSVQSFKANFQKLPKSQRGLFILMFCKPTAVKRRRGAQDAGSRRSLAATYNVRLENGKHASVCRDMFCAVLGVSHSTVTRLLKHKHEKGVVKPETRGGDQKLKLYGHKRAAVVGFIKKLRARESHYSRQKTKKLYLPTELKSIRNLWRMYNSEAPSDQRVKYGLFHRIFRTKFNLSFGTPRTDVCSLCLKNAHLIKTIGDPAKKQLVLTEQRVHKLKYKAFYALLRERRTDLKTFSFDCQQNQVMPKVPDQQAYYSRQLYHYNLCVVENQTDGSMPKHAVHCCTWSENESTKGSNQIASAVHNTLRSANYEGVEEVRLLADGCAGQNKNSIVICMILWWLQNEAPPTVSKVSLVFPVTGHSFLPPDRVFGRIEKDIRKREEILNPAAYNDIFAEHGTVLELGRHWDVYDWKSYSTEVLRPTSSLPFKISATKMFHIQRCENERSPRIRAEPHYRFSQANPVSVLKRGKRLTQAPDRCELYAHQLNPLKVKDVTSLLIKHFGESWKEQEPLSYFVEAFSTAQGNEVEANSEEDCTCCLEEMPSVHV